MKGLPLIFGMVLFSYQNRYIDGSIKIESKIKFFTIFYSIGLKEPLFRYAFRISSPPQNSRIVRGDAK